MEENKLFEELQQFLFYHNRKYTLTKLPLKGIVDYSLFCNQKGWKLLFTSTSIKKVENYLYYKLSYNKFFSYHDEYECLLEFIRFEFPSFSVISDKNSIKLYELCTLIEEFTFKKEIVDYFKEYYEYSYIKLYPYICKKCNRPFDIINYESNAIIYECSFCKNKKLEIL